MKHPPIIIIFNLLPVYILRQIPVLLVSIFYLLNNVFLVLLSLVHSGGIF